MSCVVWGCSNNNPATADPSVNYYVFPKHPVICQQWVDACGWSSSDVDVSIARMCSIHFSDDCYTTEVKLIEYITCYTKVLKFNAVPTLFLPLQTQIVVKNCSPHTEVGQVIIYSDTSQQKEYTQLKTSTEQKIEEKDLAKYRHVQTKEQLATIEKCNAALRDKVGTLENNVKRLRESLIKQVEMYKNSDLMLSNLHHEYLSSKRAFLSLQQQKVILSKVFSESQIKILSGKKKIYWSNDDMAVGYTIRHLSNKRCYMYLAKKLNIPLPAVSSIKRWMTLKDKDERKMTARKKAEPEDENSD